MSLIEQIVARAKANKQRIVLPEAEEERTLIAADKVLEQEIADLILIGNPAKVDALAKQHNLKNIGNLHQCIQVWLRSIAAPLADSTTAFADLLS